VEAVGALPLPDLAPPEAPPPGAKAPAPDPSLHLLGKRELARAEAAARRRAEVEAAIDVVRVPAPPSAPPLAPGAAPGQAGWWRTAAPSTAGSASCDMGWSALQRRFGGGTGWYLVRRCIPAAERIVGRARAARCRVEEGGASEEAAEELVEAASPGHRHAEAALSRLRRCVRVATWVTDPSLRLPARVASRSGILGVVDGTDQDEEAARVALATAVPEVGDAAPAVRDDDATVGRDGGGDGGGDGDGGVPAAAAEEDAAEAEEDEDEEIGPWRPLKRLWLRGAPLTPLDVHFLQLCLPQHSPEAAELEEAASRAGLGRAALSSSSSLAALSWVEMGDGHWEGAPQPQPPGDEGKEEDGKRGDGPGPRGDDPALGAAPAAGPEEDAAFAAAAASARAVFDSVVERRSGAAPCCLELDLSSSPRLRPRAIALLTGSLRCLSRGLRSVDLGYCTLGRGGLASLCASLTGSASLRRVTLPGCGLGPWAAPPLVDLAASCPGLEALELPFNALRAPGIGALCRLIGGRAPSGREVFSRGSSRQRSRSGQRGRPGKAPEPAAKPHPTLVDWDLRSTSMGAAGGLALVESLRQRARWIEGESRRGGPAGAASGVRRLLVADNNITPAAAAALAGALRWGFGWRTSRTMRCVLPDFPQGLDAVWSERLLAESAVLGGFSAMSDPSFMNGGSLDLQRSKHLERLKAARRRRQADDAAADVPDGSVAGALSALWDARGSLTARSRRPSLVSLDSAAAMESLPDPRGGLDAFGSYASVPGSEAAAEAPDWIQARFPVQHAGGGGAAGARVFIAGHGVDLFVTPEGAGARDE